MEDIGVITDIILIIMVTIIMDIMMVTDLAIMVVETIQVMGDMEGYLIDPDFREVTLEEEVQMDMAVQQLNPQE